MKRAALILLVLTLMLGGTSAVVYAEQEIDIMISPNVINLKTPGTWVTIHADIPFSEVVEGSVSLEGIPVSFIKEDDNGDLVAKFAIADVRAILSNGYVELTLEGVSTSGDFFGVDIIRVITTGHK